MSNVVLAIVIVFFALWNVILSAMFLKYVRHYKRLKLNNSQTLYDYLEKVFSELSQMKNLGLGLEERIKKLESKSLVPLQKFSLLRFNPFGDVGGDQSFSAAMLDDAGNGIVISSLHGRSTTRVYAKPVIKGDSKKYELSDEEKEAIKLALKK